MKEIRKMIKGLQLLALILLMTNCVKDEAEDKNILQSASIAKTWFDSNKNNYNNSILDYVKDLQWQDAIISNGEKGEVIEVPFTLTGNLSATNKEANLHNDYHRLMFFKEKDNDYKLFYVQIFTAEKLDKNINYYSIADDFNGKIFIQELTTKIGTKLEFTEGKKLNKSITARYDSMTCVYYGYWYDDGYFQPLYEVGCFGNDGGSGGNPGDNLPPSYGAGGGGSSNGSSNANDIVKRINILPSGPKIDPKKENKCFDLSQSAELTIYVQQGKEGTRALIGPNEVGHVFIGIKQDGIERYYGFYPESNANTAAVTVGITYDSELRDNSGDLYHVSISKSISAVQLSSIVNYANNRPTKYNVNDYACTDFGIAVGKLVGINLPSTKTSSWPFNGTSPGNLGEDIKSGTFPNATITTQKAYAPNRKGDCK